MPFAPPRAQGGGFGALQLIIAFAGFLKPAGDIGVLEFIYWLSPMVGRKGFYRAD